MTRSAPALLTTGNREVHEFAFEGRTRERVFRVSFGNFHGLTEILGDESETWPVGSDFSARVEADRRGDDRAALTGRERRDVGPPAGEIERHDGPAPPVTAHDLPSFMKRGL